MTALVKAAIVVRKRPQSLAGGRLRDTQRYADRPVGRPGHASPFDQAVLQSLHVSQQAMTSRQVVEWHQPEHPSQ